MQGIGDVFNIDTANAEFPNAHRNFYSNDYYSNDFYSNDFAPKDVRKTCGWQPICNKKKQACKDKWDRYNQCANSVMQYNLNASTDTTSGGGSSTPQDTVSAPAQAHDSTPTGGGILGGAKGGLVVKTADDGSGDGSKQGSMGMSTGMWIFVIVALLVISFLAYKNFTHKKPQ